MIYLIYEESAFQQNCEQMPKLGDLVLKRKQSQLKGQETVSWKRLRAEAIKKMEMATAAAEKRPRFKIQSYHSDLGMLGYDVIDYYLRYVSLHT